MPDRTPPHESPNPGFKPHRNLPPTSKATPDDPSIDEEHEHPKPPQRRQSITFDTDAALSPSSKSKLQKALTDENARAKKSWVDRNAKELHEALAKGRWAESSTSGFSASAERWSVREGTAQDLRSTLTQIFEKYGPVVMMYKGHDALGRHWVSGWKASSEQMAVVICIEKEGGKNQSPVEAASVEAGTSTSTKPAGE